MEPTSGGINLEDIKAPECFIIEQALRERMKIPVMHDDQHGTAIIAAAALVNACFITGRNVQDVKLVVNGPAASALPCTYQPVASGSSAAESLARAALRTLGLRGAVLISFAVYISSSV